MNIRAWFSGLRFKLLQLNLLTFIVIWSMNGASYIGTSRMQDTIHGVIDHDVPSAVTLGKINTGLMTLQVDLFEAHATSTSDHAKRDKYIAKAEIELNDLDKNLNRFSKLEMTASEKKIFATVTDTWSKQKEGYNQVVSLLKQHSEAENAKALSLLSTSLDEGIQMLDAEFGAFNEAQEKILETTKIEAVKSNRNMNILIFTVGIVGGVLSLVMGTMLSGRLTEQLSTITERLMGAGKLLGTSSTDLRMANNGLSKSVADSAASLQETAASVEEISSMVRQSAQNANDADQRARSSSEMANHGKDIVERMKHAVNDVRSSNNSVMEQVEHSNEQIGEIAKVISNIADKTRVINDIVFQTKLLSFNASVEAARAGEHGKGFAVVAEEIGNLAQMSGTAAREIETMLQSSNDHVQKIISESRDGIGQILGSAREKIERSTEIADECEMTLEKIVESFGSVTNNVNEIAVASKEQSQGLGQINQALNQLDAATQKNAAMTDEASSIAANLSTQSTDLGAMVAELNKLVTGKETARPAPKTVASSTVRVSEVASSEQVAQKAPQKKNVVNMKSKAKPAMDADSNAETKTASLEVPKENDARFKDI